MAVISGSIPNLINGVSQQPFALRLASQAEEQINGFSSIVEGLTKRPPTKHVAKLMASLPDNAFVHIINRDVNERYVVVATNGDLKVYDFNGNEKVVNFPSGKGYLSSALCNFGAVTVADYTFFLNKDVVTQMTGEVYGARGNEALVYIRQGNYSTTYNIVINGSWVLQKITSQTDPNDIKSDNIAEFFRVALNNSGWPTYRVGSTLLITAPGGAGFNIRTEDSLGDTAMVCITKKTQTFTNLPARCFNGYQVEIEGAPGTNLDNYYLQYDDTQSQGNNGVWREIPRPGRQIAFNAATMPHTLIRNADGTFTFGPATWDKCEAGSETISPPPSFVGKRIADIFFYRNRLGFIADESVCFSRSSKFFNFWRETATDILDTDPIDLTTSHVKVSILRHAIPFNESLLLFSDQTQFMLGAGEVLTPGGASLDQVTEFETSDKVRPVGAGSYVYFATQKGEFTGIREYYMDGQTRTNNANDVTSHVPRYIKGNVFKMTASTNEDILIALADENRHTAYVYKYFYSGQEKVQSSWSKWVFDEGASILNAEFIESSLWLVVKRADGVYLERLDIEIGKTDPGLDFVVHVDRRVTQAQVQSLHFDGAKTTFRLPYVLPDPSKLLIVAGAGDPTYRPGQVVPYTVADGVYTVKGNLASFYAGISYELRYTFSPLLVREDAPGGGRVANTEGRIQVRRCLINYADSGYFRIEVTPERRSKYEYVFTGRIVGSGRNTVGKSSVETGSFKFPVMTNNMTVKIELVNDNHMPSRHLNMDWEADYTVRTQRMM